MLTVTHTHTTACAFVSPAALFSAACGFQLSAPSASDPHHRLSCEHGTDLLLASADTLSSAQPDQLPQDRFIAHLAVSQASYHPCASAVQALLAPDDVVTGLSTSSLMFIDADGHTVELAGG
jgi:hypothetical protein